MLYLLCDNDSIDGNVCIVIVMTVVCNDYCVVLLCVLLFLYYYYMCARVGNDNVPYSLCTA